MLRWLQVLQHLLSRSSAVPCAEPLVVVVVFLMLPLPVLLYPPLLRGWVAALDLLDRRFAR